MSTSVKIAEQDKEILEKLQAMVALKAGREITQREILSRLIREAYAGGIRQGFNKYCIGVC